MSKKIGGREMINNPFERQIFSTMEEVQGALTEPFPDYVIKDRNGYPYIPVEHIKQRLISVLGVDGFDVIYSDIVHHEEDWITCDCTIIADFSLWGSRVKKVTQSDGIQIARLKANGSIVDLGNSYKTVRSSAFVKAAQELGVGLYLQFIKNDSNANKGQSHNSNSNRNNLATNNQKNAANSMERKLQLSDKNKQKLINQLFGHSSKEFTTNPTFKQMNVYIQTLKPVCDIINLITSNSSNPREKEEIQRYILEQLSIQMNKRITSFISLLTIANEQTVEFTNNLLKRTA